METLYKTFRAEVREINEETGEVDMFIPVCTDSVDRDGETVEPLAFKKTLPKFMKRPILVASHDYRELTSQIGEWSKLKIEDTGLNGKPKYYINEGNEQADWGFKLASKGMAAFSIGFIPKVWEDGDGVKTPRRTYKEVELLEISQVIVPSNREAIQSIRGKSVDPIITEICDEVERELVTKPEPDVTENYIRLRQRDPGDFQEGSFRTITISASEGIKAVIGRLKGETTTTVQSYLFDKDKWTVERAQAWVREHKRKSLEVERELTKGRDGNVERGDGVITKPEETEDYIRIPVSEGHGGHRIRTITISDKEGIKALYCGECKKVITYLFAKDHGWTMAKARAWVKEHAKEYLIAETTTTESDDISIVVVKIPDTPQIYKEEKVSQEEIIDEIDYLKTLIEKEGLSDKAKESFKELIKRLPADDIAVKDKEETLTYQDIQESIKRIMEVKTC